MKTGDSTGLEMALQELICSLPFSHLSVSASGVRAEMRYPPEALPDRLKNLTRIWILLFTAVRRGEYPQNVDVAWNMLVADPLHRWENIVMRDMQAGNIRNPPDVISSKWLANYPRRNDVIDLIMQLTMSADADHPFDGLLDHEIQLLLDAAANELADRPPFPFILGGADRIEFTSFDRPGELYEIRNAVEALVNKRGTAYAACGVSRTVVVNATNGLAEVFACMQDVRRRGHPLGGSIYGGSLASDVMAHIVARAVHMRALADTVAMEDPSTATISRLRSAISPTGVTWTQADLEYIHKCYSGRTVLSGVSEFDKTIRMTRHLQTGWVELLAGRTHCDLYSAHDFGDHAVACCLSPCARELLTGLQQSSGGFIARLDRLGKVARDGRYFLMGNLPGDDVTVANKVHLTTVVLSDYSCRCTLLPCLNYIDPITLAWGRIELPPIPTMACRYNGTNVIGEVGSRAGWEEYPPEWPIEVSIVEADPLSRVAHALQSPWGYLLQATEVEGFVWRDYSNLVPELRCPPCINRLWAARALLPPALPVEIPAAAMAPPAGDELWSEILYRAVADCFVQQGRVTQDAPAYVLPHTLTDFS